MSSVAQSSAEDTAAVLSPTSNDGAVRDTGSTTALPISASVESLTLSSSLVGGPVPASLSVAERLQIAFELPAAEALIAEHTCWLIKDVLLKGCIFLTEGHLCFHASLPKEEGQQLYKSGFLARKSNKSKQFTSYWFELKDGVLAYYENSRDQYQPLGCIDLKLVLDVCAAKRRPNTFKLVTAKKKYSLQATSAQAMSDWRKTIEAAVFCARNQGDHVRVVLPFTNITDVKLLQAANFADTIAVSVQDVDDEDANTSDEYYFSYFLDARALFAQLRSIHSKLGASGVLASGGLDALSDALTAAVSLVLSPDAPSTPAPELSDAAPAAVGDRPSDWRLVDRLPHFCGTARLSSRPSPLPQRRATESPASSSPVKAGPSQHLSAQFPLLPNDCTATASFMCYLFTGVLPKVGRLQIMRSPSSSSNFLLFRSRVVGVKSKAFIPCSDIVLARKQSGIFRFGMAILMKDYSELWFEFHTGDQRNKCLELVSALVPSGGGADGFRSDSPSGVVSDSDDEPVEADTGGRQLATSPRRPSAVSIARTSSIHSFSHFRHPSYILGQIHRADKNFATAELSVAQLYDLPPMLASLNREKDLVVRPPEPLVITCLTIGTRGDVQPFIALCKGLMAYGHRCRIATHAEYRQWVESHGIEFRVLSGNPADIMRLCVDNGMFSLSFIMEAISSFKDWLEDLMQTAWQACQGTQLIIESPVSMAGFHIAEKLGVPYLATFTMPWTRTGQFPHPFAVPNVPLGAGYNSMTWAMIEQVYWTGVQPIINRFRKNVLDIPPAVGTFYDDSGVPFIYNFSPSVVSQPPDWKDNIHICGYWFLDNPDSGWTPPADLLEFLDGMTEEARRMPIVYIGFGSIIVPDPDVLTATIVKAVQKAGVRAVISKGWSARKQGESEAPSTGNTVAPPSASDTVYFLSSVPHDWLFPRVDAVVHHGGAGTTAAGLRAGVPTLIKPFFGDQYFWASRLSDLGIGTSIKRLDIDSLKSGLVKVTKDQMMIRKAKAFGERIRREDGVATAIACIHRTAQSAKFSSRSTGGAVTPKPSEATVPVFSSSFGDRTSRPSGMEHHSAKSSADISASERQLTMAAPLQSLRQLAARRSPAKLGVNGNSSGTATDGYASDTSVNYGGSDPLQQRESTPTVAGNSVIKPAPVTKPNKLRRKALLSARASASDVEGVDESQRARQPPTDFSLWATMRRKESIPILSASTSQTQIAGVADMPTLTASSSTADMMVTPTDTPTPAPIAAAPARSRLPFQKHRQNQSDTAAFLQSMQRRHRQNTASLPIVDAADEAASAAPRTRRSIFRFWN